MSADRTVRMTVFHTTSDSRGAVYTRRYFSGVNVPKAPRPSEKLPTMSMSAGASVRAPTTTTSDVVRNQVRDRCMSLTTNFRQEPAALGPQVQLHLLALAERLRRVDPQQDGHVAHTHVQFAILAEEQRRLDPAVHPVQRARRLRATRAAEFHELNAHRHGAALAHGDGLGRLALQRPDGRIRHHRAVPHFPDRPGEEVGLADEVHREAPAGAEIDVLRS